MLILTRKAGESVFIGEEIEVAVTEIKGTQVRIGIDAPRDRFPVHRDAEYAGRTSAMTGNPKRGGAHERMRQLSVLLGKCMAENASALTSWREALQLKQEIDAWLLAHPRP